MERDKPKDSTKALPALVIFRGVYNRVAVKLGVDPSYVSRVARGERRSPAIVAALEEEMTIIREHLNHHLDRKPATNGDFHLNGDGARNGFSDREANGNGAISGKKKAAKRVKTALRSE
jgi:hypothetical protein